MRYNYHELKNEEHKWALIEAIVLDGKDHANMIENSDGVFDIEFTINGQPRDYMKTVDNLLAQLERMVEERAKELFDARFGDVNDALYDIEQTIRQKHLMFEQL